LQVLLYARSHRRIAAELAARAPQVRPLLLHDGGTLTCGDEPIEPDRAEPEIAWLSRDLLVNPKGPGREFFRLVLASQNVRWLQSGVSGTDLPLLPDLVARGVRLTTSDASADAIAEFVLTSVLCVLQPVEERLAQQRERRWMPRPFREIGGTSWLIVGYGNVGRATARRARALGAHVVGVRRTAGPCEHAAEIVSPDLLPARLGAADVVLLAVPGGASTRQLADASFLARLREGAILVNVARGSVLDEAALLEGLEHRRPEWAILDVFEKEPLPAENPLWGHPRVRVTPHTAAASTAVTARGDRVFLDNLARYLRGDPLRLEVEPMRLARSA
jgi:phosphoglycerate dehydrogenase-like enzyme